MTSILYYSRNCENCKKLLYALSRVSIGNGVHFICIDKRETAPTGETYIIMDNGERIIMPPAVKYVPALLILNQNKRVIFGKDIEAFLIPSAPKQQHPQMMMPPQSMRQPQQQHMQPAFQDEPSCFSIGSSSTSDSFSFLDERPDQMMAQGNAGLRTMDMHSYSTLAQFDQPINTPEENYSSNKATTSDYEMLKQQRDSMIQMPRPQFR